MVVTITSKSTEEEIEAALKKLDEARNAADDGINEGVDVYEFVGSIKLKEDPLDIQKKWRNEWK